MLHACGWDCEELQINEHPPPTPHGEFPYVHQVICTGVVPGNSQLTFYMVRMYCSHFKLITENRTMYRSYLFFN